MYQVQNIKVWIFTTVLIITATAGDYFQGYFTNSIEDVNRKATGIGWQVRLPKTWLFVGFLFGILLAGTVAGFLSLVFLSPSLKTIHSSSSWSYLRLFWLYSTSSIITQEGLAEKPSNVLDPSLLRY